MESRSTIWLQWFGQKTFVSPNLSHNPFNKFKIFRTVRMEHVFKQIFILVLSGCEFRSPCQLYRTDWFNFQTEISRHFVTGDWNGQIVQEKRWTIYPEAFRVGHLTKPFPDQNFQIFCWMEYNPRIFGSFELTHLFSRENRSLHEFCSRGSKFSSKRRNNEINQFNDLKFLIASLIFDSWFSKTD